MTKEEVLQELAQYGNAGTKKILMRHGAREPFFGVKVQDLKKIVKKVKKDHQLALDLFASGNSDAMYLAGLIADEKQITKEQLNRWVREAYWYFLSEYAVAWIAADSPYGYELALEWIDSDEERIASCGWATLSSVLSVTKDEELDLLKFQDLLDFVGENIHAAQNRVRYAMNGFVIAAGSFVPALTDQALDIGQKIGKVHVDVGGTACKVPMAVPYIQKVIDKGRIGKKKKMARC